MTEPPERLLVRHRLPRMVAEPQCQIGRMTRPLKALTGLPPRRSLEDFIGTLPPSSNVLGLTHVTSGYVLRDIIETGAISPAAPCKVLKEPLVYLFYGRPSYRTGINNGPTSLAFHCPVVVIVDPALTPPPKYAFCFDSGAFVDGMMDTHLHPYMPLFDFSIPPDVKSASTLVNGLFGSPERYLACSEPITFVPDPANFEATSYCSIVKNASSLGLDDRASTPEFAYDRGIDLVPWVKSVILPDSLSGDKNFGGKLTRLGIPTLDYEWQGGCRPNEYHVLIRRLVKQVYEGLNWL